MRKLILLLIVSCKNYKDFMGYASNDNSNCFNYDIFRLEKDEEKFSENINYIRENGNKIVETDKYLYNYGFYSLQIINKEVNIRKVLIYDNNGTLKEVFFYGNEEQIHKNTKYNKQGAIIKDTLYNNYNICWKEAIAIAKHKAKKEIKRFNVTNFNLSGYIENNSPKWSVKLTPDGKETLDAYYDYLYEQGGEGKDKGERYIIIDAETGEILKDYRRKIRRTAVEYD